MVPIFVVGEHDGNQDGIRADSLLQLVEFYNTVLIHIQVGDLKPRFSRSRGMKNGMMLDLADDVFSLDRRLLAFDEFSDSNRRSRLCLRQGIWYLLTACLLLAINTAVKFRKVRSMAVNSLLLLII